MFIGGYFLRFLGTVILLLYQIIICLILGKKAPSFMDVWSTPNTDDYSGTVTNELKQKIIGFIFLMLFFLIFVW